MIRISSFAAIAALAVACTSKSTSSSPAPAPSRAATATIDAAAAPPRLIDLPAVPEASARPLRASTYVLITRDGARADGLLRSSAGADSIDVATLGRDQRDPTDAAPPAPSDPSAPSAASDVNPALDEPMMGHPDRARAIDAGPNAGILDRLGDDRRGAFASLTAMPQDDVPESVGTVLADGATPPEDALLVAADRGARARRVPDALFGTLAVIGVSTDGGAHARALRVLFGARPSDDPGPPFTPMLVFTVDSHLHHDELESVYRQAAELHRDDPTRDVRLVVGADATVAHLVLAIDTLAAAGATRIAITDAEPAPPARAAGDRLGADPDAGSYDKQLIRDRMRAAAKPARACYERRLVEAPKLAGTITVKFEIGLDGRVTGAVGDGFDPQVARCVADVVKGLRFPSPPSGLVRVSYPFVFRTSDR